MSEQFSNDSATRVEVYGSRLPQEYLGSLTHDGYEIVGMKWDAEKRATEVTFEYIGGEAA